MSQQDDFIFKANMKRFEQRLKNSTDEGERKLLKNLIAQERDRYRASNSVPG